MKFGTEFAPFFFAETEDVIDGHACHMLMTPAVENTGLVFVETEAFVLNDLSAQSQKALELFRVVAAEGQIVGVTGVTEPKFSGQSVESIVHFAGDLIAHSGTGGSSLNTVSFPHRHMEEIVSLFDSLTFTFGTQNGQGGCHGETVAKGYEETAHSGKCDRGKEVGQIHLDHHFLAHMRTRPGFYRATFDETVSMRWRWELFHNLTENLSLNFLESCFGGHNEAMTAACFGDSEENIVTHLVLETVNRKVAEHLHGEAEGRG